MRTRRHLALIAVLAALSLFIAACSSDNPEPEVAQGDGSRVGKSDGKKKGNAGKDKAGSKKGNGGNGGNGRNGGNGGNNPAPGAPGNVPASPGASPGAAGAPATGGFASNGPPSPVDPSLARASANADDSPSDAQKEGVVPAHGELVGASVQGLGEQFQMRMTFGGTVPQKTESDKTVMVIGFGISAGGNDTYGFTARGGPEGWKAYAGAKHKARKFPGNFSVEGDSIVMTVPWSFINGPREFKWQANMTWFRSVANTTHYSFDMTPDKQSAQFPN